MSHLGQREQGNSPRPTDASDEPAVSVQSSWVRVGRAKVHVRTAGPAPGPRRVGPTRDVLLVHGLGMSSRYLTRAVSLLGRDHRVFAPDLPGFGLSTRPDRPMGVTAFARTLLAMMDAAELDQVALVGHSMGCQVAGDIAARSPHRVSRLVLASPSRDPRARWPWQYAWRLLLDGPREEPSLVPLAVMDYLRAGPARMWRNLTDSMQVDPTQRIRCIRQPVLIVRGERDPVATQHWASTLTALLDDVQLVTLPGAPHGLPYSSVDAFTREVSRFLAADRQAGSRSGPSLPG